MDHILKPVTNSNCLYVDNAGKKYFCVGDFVREHHLPEHPEFKMTVARVVKRMRPDVLILEEQN